MNEKINEGALNAFLYNEDGPVGLYIQRRGENVKENAVRNASGEVVNSVSGELLRGMFARQERHNGEICSVIGSDANKGGFYYPAFLNEGGKSKRGKDLEPKPWLTQALEEEFQG